MHRGRGRSLIAATAAAILVAGGALTLAPARADQSLPSFGRPAISSIQGWGFEPNLRIDTHGRMYMSVPNTASSGYSFIWRSLDGGQTWKWVPASAPYIGKITSLPTCAGGGDTELATDSNDHLYFNDLTLANFSTARSADQGTTFAPTSCASVATTPDDRQWYTVEGDPTSGGSIELAYNIAYSVANPGAGTCQPSNQLALERSPAFADVTGQSAGIVFAPPQTVTDITTCNEGIMGPDEVHTYGAVKRVFIPHDNAAYTDMRVARCDLAPMTTPADTGFANCVDKEIASFPNAITGGNFPVLSIDNAGNIYVVWEQALYDHTNFAVTGDCVLYMSVSHDQGDTWSTPAQIPTPGLHNNVYAWIAAGDGGRADLVWYGTDSVQGAGQTGGPTSAEGDWSLYFAQTLDGGQTWTAPINAGEHFVHRGHIFTLLGLADPNNPLGPSLDTQRTATGDFLQMRIGPQGEADITYTDSNHPFEGLGAAAFVRQNSGTSVLADPSLSTVHGLPAATGSIGDPAGDATLDANGLVSSSFAGLDILGASATRLDPQHYRFTINVADLRSLAPPVATDAATDVVWQISWLRPEGRDSSGNGDANGGHHFFAYMESNNGAAPTFFDGDTAFLTAGNGALQTYPGAHTITGSYTPTAPGTITLDVPVADVSPAIPIDQTLYSLTAATMLLQRPANSVPAVSGIGGEPFDLIDVAAPFDLPANPSTDVPEGLTALLAGTALLAVTGASVWRRRRRGIAAA